MMADRDEIGSVIERAAASSGAGGVAKSDASSPELARQIEELRATVAELTISVSRIPRGETLSASDALDDLVAEVEDTLKRNVFATVGIAVFVGYVWGRFR